MLICCPFYILSAFRGLDLDSLDQQEAMEGQSENVVVEKEKPWLGESQVLLKCKPTVERKLGGGCKGEPGGGATGAITGGENMKYYIPPELNQVD